MKKNFAGLSVFVCYFGVFLISSIECVEKCTRLCPPCPEESCSFGSDWEYCLCCEKCLQGPNKACGGPNGQLGKCSSGYFCDQEGMEGSGSNPKGICRKKSPECEPCNPSECVAPQQCENGVGKDNCGCCSECLKGIREPCGGSNDMHGTCGEGLYCDEGNGVPGTCQAWFLDTNTPYVG